MTLDRAQEKIREQLAFGSGHDLNRDADPLLSGEVQREHGQAAVDTLIRELGLEVACGLTAGPACTRVGR